jgi:hypothetical protein
MAIGERITILDVGDREYGECLLIETGGRRILIDGSHQGDDQDAGTYRGIARQLRDLTGEQKVALDLLVVSHAHADHVGSLPDLVAAGVIESQWAFLPDPDLAWGRQPGQPAPDLADPVRAAIAGLREEDPSAETFADDAALALFLSDSVSLEKRYADLIADLGQQGTKIVRHGSDDEAPLVADFSAIGLQILGPSLEQMKLTAQLMGEAIDAFASDALKTADRLPDVDDHGLALYRSLRATPAADAPKSRPGNMVNLQSASLALLLQGRRAFFGGDMELADPESANLQLRAEVTALRARIRAQGTYSYAQLGHHGSANATSSGTLDDLGQPRLVGMSAGRASDKHPSSDVLQLLALGGQQWVRTDRNGQIIIEPRGSKGWTLRPARGTVNDPTPPGADAHVAPTPAAAPTPIVGPSSPAPSSLAASVKASPVPSPTSPRSDAVEVTIRTSRPVVVTIRLDDPGAGSAGDSAATIRADAPALSLAAGRQLPRLLYVTDPNRLAANVGASETDQVMAALRAAPGHLVEVDGSGSPEAIRAALEGSIADVEGVVIVGGYDVVSSEVVDTLPAGLATSISREGDADQFVVWSDDRYGQRPGATALPISRVPDGHSAQLLYRALSTPGPRARSASGVRNINRPFAETVYTALQGGSPLLVSEPLLAAEARGRLAGDTVYFMLHGYWRDGTRFWGEAGAAYPEAMNVASVDAQPGNVVFSGACWGALTVGTQAMRYTPGSPLGSRGPTESIALAYLAGGASAFVGCTGSHYSPSNPPYRSAGAPIHLSFFTYLSTGLAPAAALAQAKLDYVAAMPHSDTGPGALAVEHKLVWEFTCLGLGW